MCRRMIAAKYTGCGKKPIGTSRFCFSDWLACTSPGPPVIEDRCVAHATGNTLSTCRASPRAIAPAARAGAVPAQLIPPPHGDDHTSWSVPKWSWNAATSKSAKAALYVRPSMSDGSRPLSAIARSAASAPISRAVRPDAFVYAVSPIPTIATAPPTSSNPVAWPQSSGTSPTGAEATVARRDAIRRSHARPPQSHRVHARGRALAIAARDRRARRRAALRRIVRFHGVLQRRPPRRRRRARRRRDRDRRGLLRRAGAWVLGVDPHAPHRRGPPGGGRGRRAPDSRRARRAADDLPDEGARAVHLVRGVDRPGRRPGRHRPLRPDQRRGVHRLRDAGGGERLPLQRTACAARAERLRRAGPGRR